MLRMYGNGYSMAIVLSKGTSQALYMPARRNVSKSENCELRLAEDFEMLYLMPDFEMLRLTCDVKHCM